MDTKSTTELHSTPALSCSLKRKRPPKIEIPNVLQEIQADKLKFKDLSPSDDSICFSGIGVGVAAIKGNKKFMEDTHKIVSCLNGSSNKGFFGVYDGHGGKRAAEFVAENLHTNILEMMENCTGNASKEEAVKAGYLKTDQEFLRQGVASGACCVTALIEGQEIVVSNLGDCRAVLCRGGVAEVLTKDHRAEQEDERKRIENKGGYVEIHRGAWRVHGVLSVCRSIGDAHLKNWVLAEPDTMILQLTSDMDFLVLASDGLWEEVGNQEAVETVISLCMPEKKSRSTGDVQKDDEVCYGCVNVSPSSKMRRVSLLKHQKIPKQSPRNKQKIGSWKDMQDDCNCENESPPLKSRRISLFKRINTKIDSPNKENSVHKKGPAASMVGLAAACDELVNLAVRRGSMDDITVMVIDLNQFRCNS
uniref:protein-serine/threonine phosphatase n=1 Tax=Manihot esculenta TaxID=3983 RepID=A0A2C9UMX3_MANES